MNRPSIEMGASTDAERRKNRRPLFQKALEHLLNAHSMESASGTPDYLLARYLMACLRAYEEATLDRDAWHSPEAK